MKLNQRYIKSKKVDFSIQMLFVFGFLISAFCVESCKKFVDIPPPTTKLVTTNVFNNASSATSAITYIYEQMFDNSESSAASQGLGLYADELINYSTINVPQIALYTNSLQAATPQPLGWPKSYNYIYLANAVISGLKANGGDLRPAVVQQLTGEAKFIRAFWHLYLTNIYGDVPLVLTTDYTTNASIARTPRVAVLQQVVADLKDAQNLLNGNYVNTTDTAVTVDRVRPNKGAATSLLARAYLYLGDYTKDPGYYDAAITHASSVIGNSLYSLCTNLSGANSIFLKNSTEAIWQLMYTSTAGADTYDGSSYILISAPSSTSTSPQLLNGFETGDQRKANWIGTYTTTTGVPFTYYFPFKYKNRTFVGTEYTMVLRLAEQYLIRAEANAQRGNTAAAIADLNTIRNRAGLANYSGASNQPSLLAAILHERQVELFSEWGHRWFDLCRTGNANIVMSSVTPLKGGTWYADGHQLLFPIPLSEIKLDANLTQNAGY